MASAAASTERPKLAGEATRAVVGLTAGPARQTASATGRNAVGGRVLLVVSASCATAAAAVAEGRSPRKDFLELAATLRADVLDLDRIQASRVWRRVAQVLGVPACQAVAAFLARRQYDAIFCDGEHNGLVLSALLRFSRSRPRHGFIGHFLTKRRKVLLWRCCGARRGADFIVLHAQLQQSLVCQQYRLPGSLLKLLPYQVDEGYWQPSGSADARPTICAAGLEHRDYATLVEAVRDTGVRTVIAAGRRWSKHGLQTGSAPLPENLEITALDYPELRRLYAAASIVVVPLHPVQNQAGVTAVLEAMAMGKPVIVTATPGQTDVVRGRLMTATGAGANPMGGPAAFGVRGSLAEVETGLYVPPHDPLALRRAIQHLLDHPEEAAAMGSNARQVVERCMTLDRFVAALAGLIVSPLHAAGAAPAPVATLVEPLA